jgi:hypothetical protein
MPVTIHGSRSPDSFEKAHPDLLGGTLKMQSHSLSRPRIFVQIAGYRDPDCRWTIEDLFAKACHPQRTYAGLCWQIVAEEDRDLLPAPYPYPFQLRVQVSDARQSRGVCWARSVTQQLWRNEEFTLQIDSHMRFEPGWDEILLSLWRQCENPRAVLSAYMPGFTPPDTCERDKIYGMSATGFDEDGILRFIGAPAWSTGGGEPVSPVPGAFAAACMLFGPSSIIQDVPYDPDLYFFGEEISLSVRLWTHGYDIYHPNRLVMFHNWDRSLRRTHFEDHREWPNVQARAAERVRRMLGVGCAQLPKIQAESGHYGLGTARTLGQFQDFSGVDFARLTIDRKASRHGLNRADEVFGA